VIGVYILAAIGGLVVLGLAVLGALVVLELGKERDLIGAGRWGVELFGAAISRASMVDRFGLRQRPVWAKYRHWRVGPLWLSLRRRKV
jgi:hypothetical protein